MTQKQHKNNLAQHPASVSRSMELQRFSPHRKNAGFTLLEIMIALAIISIALTALLSLGNRTITVHDRLQKITQATLLAQHKMSELETTSTSTITGSDESGVFDEPNNAFTWRVDYSDTPLPSIRMVSVTVSWGDENANEAVTLDSFIF